MHLAPPYSQLVNVEFNIVEVAWTDDNLEMDRKIKIVEALSAFMSTELRDKYSSMSPSKIGLRPPNSARGEPATPSSSAPPPVAVSSPQLSHHLAPPSFELSSSSSPSAAASKRLAPKDAR